MKKTRYIKHPNNIEEIIVENNKKFIVKFLNIGAVILEIVCKDKIGKYENVLLRYENVNDFLENKLYLNCCIGPYAGRIANAEFYLDNKKYTLEKNNGPNCLHSGDSIYKKIWNYKVLELKNKTIISFWIKSSNLDNGFPGNKTFQVNYEIHDDEDLLRVENWAVADKKTIFNLTHHLYFNLSGNLKRNIKDHKISLNYDYVFQMDNNKLPISDLKIKYDKKILDLKKNNLDHLFSNSSKKLFLSEKKSGRFLSIKSSLPMVVIYSQDTSNITNFLGEKQKGKKLGLAIEFQYESNEINNKINEYNTIYEKLEYYKSETIYAFGIL